MTDLQSLRDAVIADLDSDEPRLVLADGDLVSGRGLSRLTHLRLRRCELDDRAIGYLFGTPLLDRLKVLDLRENRIGIDRLVELRARAPALEVLR